LKNKRDLSILRVKIINIKKNRMKFGNLFGFLMGIIQAIFIMVET